MPTIRTEAVVVGQTPKALGLNLKWSKTAEKSIKNIIARYPATQSRSALIPVLHLAQREFDGWLSVDAMQLVADTLELPYIRVYEVATFYTMFNLVPVGKYHIQVCTNCACLIGGSDAVMKTIEEETGLKNGDTDVKNLFTITEVECLGACVAAPMMQVTSTHGSHYLTHLTAEKTKEILSHLKKGKNPADLADTPPAPDVDPITNNKYGA
ncbi:MAG: hypothetical protein COY40_01045 [Alphaproteobacteria bacterium CG_4_10_14_0_8_um_filter_53_9]|nr:MAG: hypothetical protein COY40_01045 [Alphaproteobacteria bacterium CG_4_10_14_0_8_um_filter_53_9]